MTCVPERHRHEDLFNLFIYLYVPISHDAYKREVKLLKAIKCG